MKNKPNWAVWGQMPQLAAAEAVALSLGIDPGGTQARSREFAERLMLYTRCHAGDKLAPAEVSKWAQSVGWNVPLELAALAPQKRPADIAAPAGAVAEMLAKVLPPGVTAKALRAELERLGHRFVLINGEPTVRSPNGTLHGALQPMTEGSLRHLQPMSEAAARMILVPINSGGGSGGGGSLPGNTGAPSNSAVPTTRPVQRSAAQQAAILDAIAKLGLDPMSLPRARPGTPGVRSKVCAALGVPCSLFTVSAFKHAWEAAQREGAIKAGD
jgi:hypothetical protein